MQLYYDGLHNVSKKPVTTSGLSILLHGVYSFPARNHMRNAY